MQPISPPKAEVDDSPLHNAMDKNKESLKVKLMLRRPINQLVAQGIMPSLKTPPGFHEQRQKLERAKMGDLLKAKIQQRPDRQELVRQHILEDVGHVDPSLAEKQRLLKKCRLADSLNDQLSHRPGPLELIKKNILHTDEPIERAVKEGHIEFKATSEGHSTKPTPPDHYMLDEDSSSGSSPARDATTTTVTEIPPVLTTTVTVAPTVAAAATPVTAATTTAPKGNIVTVLLTPTAAIALPYAPAPAPAPSPSTSASTGSAPSTPRPSPAPGKDKNRKKSKTKALPKARTIKFHEYKGPPNAQKNSLQSSSSSQAETSYELLLQQQQLFLQWQLEWQHKYPQILLPASQKPPAETAPATPAASSPAPPPPPMPQSPPPGPAPPLRNLEDMKVSDLKAELKRRNLPVSGAKPQLIERLKPFSESAQNAANVASSATQSSTVSSTSSNLAQDDSTTGNGSFSLSSVDLEVNSPMAPGTPPSPAQQSNGTSPSPTVTSTQSSVAMDTAEMNEGLVRREHQRKIDQLQRQFITSHLQLQQNTFQQQNTKPPTQRDQPVTNAKANLAAFLQQQQLNQALLQQQQQQQEAIANNNNNNVHAGTIINGTNLKQRTVTEQALLNHINQRSNHQSRTGSLPNFETLVNGQSSEPSQPDLNGFIDNKTIFNTEIKTEPAEVKSQMVDDVLDILIRAGELPASAAEVGMSLETELMSSALDGMEVDQDFMDVDTDWLDSLMVDSSQPPNGSELNGGVVSSSSLGQRDSVGSFSSAHLNHRPCGDPLLAPPASSPEPAFMDLFMDETDLKIPPTEFVWDRIDFAT